MSAIDRHLKVNMVEVRIKGFADFAERFDRSLATLKHRKLSEDEAFMLLSNAMTGDVFK